MGNGGCMGKVAFSCPNCFEEILVETREGDDDDFFVSDGVSSEMLEELEYSKVKCHDCGKSYTIGAETTIDLVLN